MSVYCKKRKDGSKAWFYDFQFNGTRYRAVGGTTKTEASRSQEKVRAEVINGEYEFHAKVNNPTIGIFASKFLDRRKENRSYWRDVILVNPLLKYYKNGSLTLQSISTESVEDYKAWRKSQGVANSTVNRELGCLKRMFNLAIQWGDAKRNPVKGVKMLREPPKKDRYVTREEAAKLVEASPDYFKPILICAFNSGMRLQEILGLKWEMVHLWDAGGEIELIETKNGKKRYVPINSDLRNIFESLEQKNEYVFLGMKAKPLKSMRKPMAKTFSDSNVEKATFHDFRHSWASWMSEAGVDPYTIMEMGGWADLKTLMRYLHRTRAGRQSAMEKISGTISRHLYATSAKIHKINNSVSSL